MLAIYRSQQILLRLRWDACMATTLKADSLTTICLLKQAREQEM